MRQVPTYSTFISDPIVSISPQIMSVNGIGVGTGGARWASAHPLFEVGGPTMCFGPPTFYSRPLISI